MTFFPVVPQLRGTICACVIYTFGMLYLLGQFGFVWWVNWLVLTTNSLESCQENATTKPTSHRQTAGLARNSMGSIIEHMPTLCHTPTFHPLYPPPFFSFRLPSDGPGAPGNIYLSWLLLPHILMDLDHHTLGSAGSLLSSVLQSLYLYFCKMWCFVILMFSFLLLIISCGPSSSRSWRWTGDCVAQLTLVDASACSVVLLDLHTLHIWYKLYQILCQCKL